MIVRSVQQQLAAEAEQTAARVRRNGLGDGRLHSLLALIDQPEPDTDPEDTVAILFAPVLSALLAVGAAQVVPSWTTEASFAAPDGSDLGLRERLTAAVQARNSSQLRAWLASLGVDVMSARAVTTVPQWLAAASHITGPWHGRRDVHVWTTGVLALPLDKATIKENKEQFSDNHQHPRLYYARSEGIEAGRRQPDALWWDATPIVGSEVSGRMKPRFTVTFADRTTITLASTLETAYIESLEEMSDAVNYLGAPKDH
ncbi:MAG: hypothetical protein QM619_05645 [Micropruina sp.]|uniref:hypothetical protein n=1 Tax=Micropruina sp. TaxID=2737536 RepID=UPI0039E5A348